jgi:hypothetical protein
VDSLLSMITVPVAHYMFHSDHCISCFLVHDMFVNQSGLRYVTPSHTICLCKRSGLERVQGTKK